MYDLGYYLRECYKSDLSVLFFFLSKLYPQHGAPTHNPKF